jgi:hypothetical protein
MFDPSLLSEKLRDGTVSYEGGFNLGLKGHVRQLLVITGQIKHEYDDGMGAATGKIGKAWVMGNLDGLATGGHEDMLTEDQMRLAHEWLDSEPD